MDREQGYKKTAEFLLLLDKSRAAKVLSRLSTDEVEGIVKSIAALKKIDPAEAKKVFSEFGMPAPAVMETKWGGKETAERILKAALGEERSRVIMLKVEKKLEPDCFDFLKDINRERLQSLLADESPQIIALALVHLEPESASEILNALDGESQTEVARRIAHMGELLPEVMRRTADLLKKKLFLQSDFSTEYIDGKSALSEILKHMDFRQEQDLIDALSTEKPDLAFELEKKIFTMEIFRKLHRKDLQLFLRQIADRDLAMSLKGETQEMKDLFFSSISGRRRALILEEYEFIGEVPKNEADKAKCVILGALKMKIAKGEIIILNEKDQTFSQA